MDHSVARRTLDCVRFHLKESGSRLDDVAVYREFFEAFGRRSKEEVRSKQSASWKEVPDGTRSTFMAKFELRTPAGRVHGTWTEVEGGSSGVVLMARADDGVHMQMNVCVKFTAFDWVMPAGFHHCSAVVPVSVRVRGRVQLMHAASHDLFALHQPMARARRHSASDGAYMKSHVAFVSTFKRVSLFVAGAVEEMLMNDVVNPDIKTENVVVTYDAEDGSETYALCDVESFVDMHGGDQVNQMRCTFEPCARSAKRGLSVLTTVFAACCTVFDLANNLLDEEDKVDLAWCDDRKTTHNEWFDLGHPVVKSANERRHPLISKWALAIADLAGGKHVWGASIRCDKAHALCIVRKLIAALSGCNAESTAEGPTGRHASDKQR